MGDLNECEGTPEISNDDRYAIDVYYGFDVHNGYSLRELWGVLGGTVPTGPKVDQDRMTFMDWKDSLAEQGKKETLPLKTAALGFGAAAVLLSPAGWVLALGAGAVWGSNKLYKEWSKARTVKAYGRTFALNSKGLVIFHIRNGIKMQLEKTPRPSVIYV